MIKQKTQCMSFVYHFVIFLGALLSCMGTHPCFFSHHFFDKGNNFYEFLFASLDDEDILKGVVLFKERICSFRRNSFF